jgi:hypothetical protein
MMRTTYERLTQTWRLPVFALLLLLTTTAVFAQNTLTPGNSIFEKKWLKDGKYEMGCYALNGGNKVEVSSFAYEIKLHKETFSLFTNMTLTGASGQWIDTCIAAAGSLKPLYRSSFNPNRELVLHYGKEVTGYYYDKQTQKRNTVKEPVNEAFFDSYLYPYVLGLLPLTSGYHASLLVYDYKPEHKGNIKKAIIEEVKNSIYVSSLTGTHKTWLVSVLEQATNDKYEYYIDQETRRIWKIDIVTKGQRLQMLDKELDYNPFKSVFSKEATMKLIKGGNAVISGQAFVRDNENEGLLKGMAVLNVNKKQFARQGTSVILIPYTDFFKEWIKLNEASRKKGRAIPLPKEAAECIKVATVYDDKGHFEFVNLMPGAYLLYTEFGYTHTSHRTEVVGYTDTYINGMFQGTTENTVVNSYSSNAAATIKKVVTIANAGEVVEVRLKKTL